MPQNDAKELRKLEKDLHAKLKLHVEAEIQKQHSLVREQVLCDLLVHQDFCEKLLTAAAEVDRHEAAQLHAVLQQTLTAPVPGLCQQQSTLPCSYLAKLLRQSTVDQVQRVLSMSAQDWADYWRQLFPQFLVQLELCERSSYDESMLTCERTDSDSCDVCSAQGGGSCSSCADHRSSSPAQDPGYPNQDCNRMQQIVDDAARSTALGYHLNHVPALDSARLRLDSGSGGAPDLQHWERVADRLQLTELQEEMVSVMAAEFQRRSHSLSLEGKRLIEDTKQSGLQFSAALQHPPEQQQQQQKKKNGNVAEAAGSRRSRPPALRDLQCQSQAMPLLPPPPQQQQRQQAKDDHVTGDQGSQPLQGSQESMSPLLERDGSGPWHERLGQQLQAHMHKRLVLHQCMQSFLINTLSTYQLAMLSIASFPWAASTNLIAEVVSKRVQARHQQQVKNAVQQPRYSLSASAGGTNSHSGAGGSAGPKPARAGGADSQGKGGKGVGGGKGGGKLTYGQWAARQRERTRARELALHQHACWAQLGCELPGEQ